LNEDAMTRYQIVRQDDNGVKYYIEKKYDTRAEAEEKKEELEKHAHKQIYWVEPIEDK